MQKQRNSPQRHRVHREDPIFSNREIPIGEKLPLARMPEDPDCHQQLA